MMASPSNVLLCAIVAACVAGGESLADPKAVAETAFRAAEKLAKVCAANPLNSEPCVVAAVIGGAFFLVDFTVTYYDYQKEQENGCNVLKSDITNMANLFDLMAESTRKWDEYIDSKRYGDLLIEADNLLRDGNTFLEATRQSIIDTHDLELVATSGAHQVLPLVTTGAPVFLSYMVGQCSGLDKKILLPALVLGIAAVGLQGCNGNECPPKAMLHGDLMGILSNMEIAIGYIHNLRDCVPKGQKPICSGKELHKCSNEIRSALDVVKANMDALEKALGMRLSKSSVMPAVHTATLPSVNSANLLAFASTTSQAEAALAFISRDFEALAVKANRLSQCAPEVWCQFLGLIRVILLAAPIGLSLVCSRKTSSSEITINQTNGNYEAMSDESSDDASSTSCCRRCAQRHPLWTRFLLFMPYLAVVVFGLGVVSNSCNAAVLGHHRMHLIASKASQIHDNLQSQVECAQLGTLCSLEERAHLQKQVTHMVKDTVSELHETLAPSAGLVEAQIELQQQCTTMVACSPEELMRRQLRLLSLVKGAFSRALS